MYWMMLLLGITATVVIILLLVRVCFFLVEVRGSSMLPTFQNGDRVIALRYWPARWLYRGQIVVWVRPSQSKTTFVSSGEIDPLFIKRVIGLPGDEIVAPFINLPQSVDGARKVDPDNYEMRRWYVPRKHYFAKGDSPGFDSTQLGPLPFESLRGVVIVKLPRRMKPAEKSYLVDSISHPSQKKS